MSSRCSQSTYSPRCRELSLSQFLHEFMPVIVILPEATVRHAKEILRVSDPLPNFSLESLPGFTSIFEFRLCNEKAATEVGLFLQESSILKMLGHTMFKQWNGDLEVLPSGFLVCDFQAEESPGAFLSQLPIGECGEGTC